MIIYSINYNTQTRSCSLVGTCLLETGKPTEVKGCKYIPEKVEEEQVEEKEKKIETVEEKRSPEKEIPVEFYIRLWFGIIITLMLTLFLAPLIYERTMIFKHKGETLDKEGIKKYINHHLGKGHHLHPIKKALIKDGHHRRLVNNVVMQYERNALPHYIKSHLKKGYHINSIRKALLKHGHHSKLVKELTKDHKNQKL